MVRPKKVKCIENIPDITYFKPRGVPLNTLKEVELSFEELETIKLSNIDKLSQLESAKKMNIHQSTFQRTLSKALEKISIALIEGKAIKIHGGKYNIINKHTNSQTNTNTKTNTNKEID